MVYFCHDLLRVVRLDRCIHIIVRGVDNSLRIAILCDYGGPT